MEKASVDTSNIEEKAEEIIAEAEPPPEVYLILGSFYSNKMHTFFLFVCCIKAIMCILKFALGEFKL